MGCQSDRPGTPCYRTALMEPTRATTPVFSTSAERPGPIGLIREAVAELWSRRELVRYLVQADLSKKDGLGNVEEAVLSKYGEDAQGIDDEEEGSEGEE